METTMATIASPSRRGAGRILFALGLLLLALALMALVYEIVASVNAGSYRMIAAGELWFNLHPSSLNLSQAVVQRYLHPGIWDPVLISILQWPAWSIFGAPGAVLAMLFAPRPGRGG